MDLLCSKNGMTRMYIHLEMYNHLVSNGICQEILDTICGFITNVVSKTSIAKNSAISLATSNEFLDRYLNHKSS